MVILGDFNEGKPIGNDDQALAVLFQAKPPLVDALSTLSGKVSTHTDGKAYGAGGTWPRLRVANSA